MTAGRSGCGLVPAVPFGSRTMSIVWLARLIGEVVEVHLYAERIEVWYGQQQVQTMARILGQGKHQINYRHLIDSLVRKPGAFEHYRYRGERVLSIARDLKVRPNTVIEWRRRFAKQGIQGLKDRPRTGKPLHYEAEFRNKVLKTLELPPPSGQARWDGPAVAKHLDTSVHAVWRLLRKEGICLSRQRSWCVSTDPEFIPKSADIVGLYLNPPENAIVISVDEKPSIQALERSTGYVATQNGKIVQGFKSTYKRHGTLNLFAALEVATGAIDIENTINELRCDKMFSFATAALPRPHPGRPSHPRRLPK